MNKIAPVLINNRTTGTSRELKVGDRISFTCNGRGRGGHCSVSAKVTKINRKTFQALEMARSYTPGTKWTLDEDVEIVIKEYTEEWIQQYGDKPIAAGTKVMIDKMDIFNGGRKGEIVERLETEEYLVKIGRDLKKISPSCIKLAEA